MPAILPIPKPRDKKAMTRAKREGFAKEKDLQVLCEQYLTVRGLTFLHIPAQTLNAAFHRHRMTGPELGAARAASEYIKGYPDLTVFYRGRYKAFELKSITGSLSQSQRHWQKELGTEEIRTFEQFEKILTAWISECDEIERLFQ